MKAKRLVLTGVERSNLKRFVDGARSRGEYRRGLGVLYKADGLSYRTIGRMLRADFKSVYRWVGAYRKHGVDGLRDKPRPGRRSSFNVGIREKIAGYALNSPRLFGYLKNTWSMRLLAKHLSKELGLKVSFQHIWRILQDLGIVYKRGKAYVESPDEDYSEKKAMLEGYRRIASALAKKGSS